MSTQNALLTILTEKINNDTLVLPTLPAIALKVRRAADNPDINLNEMAEVVGQDPSLSARMIKISNSAYLGRAVKISSIHQAVTRIGLNQIKNISTALAMEQLFVSKNSLISEYMKREWTRTVDIVAGSMAALQFHLKEKRNSELSQETMTLAALVSTIGVLPILTEAERHTEVFANPAFLEDAIDKLSSTIGANIMHTWGFSQELVDVAAHWRDLAVMPDELSYIDFVRVGAALSGQMGSQEDAVMNLALSRGMISDLNVFDTEEFQTVYKSGKSIFA